MCNTGYKNPYFMFETEMLVKYDVLKSYCEQNGFGYAILSSRTDFGSIINMEINPLFENFLINSFEKFENLQWNYIKEGMSEYKANNNDMYAIIYKYKLKLQVHPFNLSKG